MSDIGDRLKLERQRLGLTQPAFAGLVGAAKRTLIDWENGVSSPTAVQLSALIGHGVDVVYVLTGERGPQALTMTARETALLGHYRVAAEEAKTALETTAALLAAAQTGVKP